MKKVTGILLILATILISCAPKPNTLATSTITSLPTSTTPPVLPIPTASPQFIDLKSGGFTLTVQPQLEFETDATSINISDKRGELIISLNGRPYIASLYSLESFLKIYVAEMATRGGSFQQSDPYEIIIDGMAGIAVDLTGKFLDDPMAGKAVAVSPGKDFIIFGLGMSNLGTHKDGWKDSGGPIFEAIIASIKFKDEIK